MIDNPRIGAIVFYVKDLPRTEKFYRDMLGLETRIDPGHADADPDHAGPWMMAKVGELSLIFFQRNEKPGRSPIVVFTLAAGGIDDIVEQLARKGVQIVTPVSEAPGGWTADFVDPDGHVLSFYQSEKAPRKQK
jgi:predicted enzyme related to lactoylglutathione lyase